MKLKCLMIVQIAMLPGYLRAQTYSPDQALYFFNKKNWTEAIKAYSYLTEQNPYNGIYWYNLGDALFYLPDYSKAKDAFIKSAETGQSPSLYVSVSYTMVKIAT